MKKIILFISIISAVSIIGYVGMDSIIKNINTVSEISNWLKTNANVNDTILFDEYDWSGNYITSLNRFNITIIPRSDRKIDNKSIINYLEQKPSYMIYSHKGRLSKILNFSQKCQNNIRFNYSFKCEYTIENYDVYNIRKIKWNEEFDSDLYRWFVHGSNESSPEGLYSSSHVFLHDGNLIIRGDIEKGNIISGYISSEEMFRYGFIEIRARVNPVSGFISQVWLKPTGWNYEIDIIEKPAKYKLCDNSVMYRNESGDMIWNSNRLDNSSNCDIDKDFHLFQLEWTSKRLVWYIDGIERFREERPKFIPHVDMLFKIALCGSISEYGCYPKDWNWDGDLDVSKLPADFIIDYIRVYENEER